MASIKKIAETLALIKTIYPYYYKENNINELKVLTQAWQMALANYDDNEVNNAAIVCIKTCKTPPTPADLIEKIEQSQAKATNEELFAKMSEALEKCYDLQYCFDFTAKTKNNLTQGQEARLQAKQLFNNLPLAIRQYIGSYGEFLRMSREIDSETLKYERTKFLKALKDIKEEIKTKNLILEQKEKTQKIENL